MWNFYPCSQLYINEVTVVEQRSEKGRFSVDLHRVPFMGQLCDNARFIRYFCMHCGYSNVFQKI